MDPRDIEDALCEAAEGHFDDLDFAGLEVYLDPTYGLAQLCEWARAKFNIRIDRDELAEKPPEEVADLLKQQVREAYRQREISYPVGQCIARAFGESSTDNGQACEIVCRWANLKYRVNWEVDEIQGRPVEEISRRLLDLQEDYLTNGKLDAQIDEAVTTRDGEALKQWGKERFGRAWDERLYNESSHEPRSALCDMGRRMLRFELSALEHYILLRIYDQAWKDHLWEMDRLKNAIMQRPMGGDQTHPQSQYAIEGREFFDEMWTRIRQHVTDVIFRLEAAGTTDPSAQGGRPSMQLQHADATNVAFSAQRAADESAAMRAQGQQQKVETIRRATPKVKRNDPCPCGSGKKYKQCCGRGAG